MVNRERNLIGAGTMKWSIRYTGRPFGPCERLGDDDFVHVYGNYATMAI